MTAPQHLFYLGDVTADLHMELRRLKRRAKTYAETCALRDGPLPEINLLRYRDALHQCARLMGCLS